MELNLRDALAGLARAANAYLSYAVQLVFAGLLVLLEFGMALIALRLARIAPSLAAIFICAVILLGSWLTFTIWQRLFLFHRCAAMLYLFSGTKYDEVRASVSGMFPGHYAWIGWRRRLRLAFIGLGRQTKPMPSTRDRLADRAFGLVVFALAFAQGNDRASFGKALALYWRHGQRTRLLAWRWLKFLAIGLMFVFLALALPSWFFFKVAGAPPIVGIVLAGVIAMFLVQAFLFPLALAGVSASLLTETDGQTPDPNLSHELALLFPEHDSPVPVKA